MASHRQFIWNKRKNIYPGTTSAASSPSVGKFSRIQGLKILTRQLLPQLGASVMMSTGPDTSLQKVRTGKPVNCTELCWPSFGHPVSFDWTSSLIKEKWQGQWWFTQASFPWSQQLFQPGKLQHLSEMVSVNVFEANQASSMVNFPRFFHVHMGNVFITWSLGKIEHLLKKFGKRGQTPPPKMLCCFYSTTYSISMSPPVHRQNFSPSTYHTENEQLSVCKEQSETRCRGPTYLG